MRDVQAAVALALRHQQHRAACDLAGTPGVVLVSACSCSASRRAARSATVSSSSSPGTSWSCWLNVSACSSSSALRAVISP